MPDLRLQDIAASLKLSNFTLAELDLSNNKIGDSGAKELAAALHTNTSLIELKVSDNKVGDTGAMEFSAALQKNTTLLTLK